MRALRGGGGWGEGGVLSVSVPAGQEAGSAQTLSIIPLCTKWHCEAAGGNMAEPLDIQGKHQQCRMF